MQLDLGTLRWSPSRSGWHQMAFDQPRAQMAAWVRSTTWALARRSADCRVKRWGSTWFWI